jgi:NTP pyrophosphatase (non-canonical NTP hydrolase)
MTTLAEVQQLLIDFRDEREWQQFHSLKNLIVSLNLEAAEVLELVQWKTDAQAESLIRDERLHANLRDECADVLSYLLLICEVAGIDLLAATVAKIEKNRVRYPVDLARGSANKYDKLTDT